MSIITRDELIPLLPIAIEVTTAEQIDILKDIFDMLDICWAGTNCPFRDHTHYIEGEPLIYFIRDGMYDISLTYMHEIRNKMFRRTNGEVTLYSVNEFESVVFSKCNCDDIELSDSISIDEML